MKYAERVEPVLVLPPDAADALQIVRLAIARRRETRRLQAGERLRLAIVGTGDLACIDAAGKIGILPRRQNLCLPDPILTLDTARKGQILPGPFDILR